MAMAEVTDEDREAARAVAAAQVEAWGHSDTLAAAAECHAVQRERAEAILANNERLAAATREARAECERLRAFIQSVAQTFPRDSAIVRDANEVLAASPLENQTMAEPFHECPDCGMEVLIADYPYGLPLHCNPLLLMRTKRERDEALARVEKLEEWVRLERRATGDARQRCETAEELCDEAHAECKRLRKALREARPFVESSPLYGGKGYMTDKIDALLSDTKGAE